MCLRGPGRAVRAACGCAGDGRSREKLRAASRKGAVVGRARGRGCERRRAAAARPCGGMHERTSLNMTAIWQAAGRRAVVSCDASTSDGVGGMRERWKWWWSGSCKRRGALRHAACRPRASRSGPCQFRSCPDRVRLRPGQPLRVQRDRQRHPGAYCNDTLAIHAPLSSIEFLRLKSS